MNLDYLYIWSSCWKTWLEKWIKSSTSCTKFGVFPAFCHLIILCRQNLLLYISTSVCLQILWIVSSMKHSSVGLFQKMCIAMIIKQNRVKHTLLESDCSTLKKLLKKSLICPNTKSNPVMHSQNPARYFKMIFWSLSWVIPALFRHLTEYDC